MIKNITAYEILDSRGNPTIEAQVTLESGLVSRAATPSGASTGRHEAWELRDNDQDRYHGKGVRKAVDNVKNVIAPALVGRDPQDQAELDQLMIELDGSPNKSRLGANAILAVSMALSRAAAQTNQVPLYKHLRHLYSQYSKTPFKNSLLFPIPMMNLINGGQHATNSVDMQEYMIVPFAAPSFSEAVRWGSEIFHTLGKILGDRQLSVNIGDEGGYAPALKNNQEPLDLIMEAIQGAGYQPGEQVALALDPAASEFYRDGQYHLDVEDKTLSTDQLIALYEEWINRYPIVSIEDGLDEDDWEGFNKLTASVKGKTLNDFKMQVVGDDLYATNPERLDRGIASQASNSILVKLNQIGSVTETLKVIATAKQNNWTVVVSHRSGETEDTFIADLALGVEADQIKTGSLSRSERTAKYNRLIRIEQNILDQALDT